MHLLNILNQLGANKEECEKIKLFFMDKVVSHSAVVHEFCKLREIKNKVSINNNP
tara:strand:+ start:75 stop:239 length:165 start_codon:yes stop_codon:yes gene_type:complete